MGVDFSGNAEQWRPNKTNTNVWIARAEAEAGTMRLLSLQPVHALAGNGPPFERLGRALAAGDVTAAAIDAPFGLPQAVVNDPAPYTWARTANLPRSARPFCKGETLVRSFAPDLPPRGKKLLRQTERAWQARGVNVRSTTWYGPRGGAPFAAACMTLLAAHQGPVWPFRNGGNGTLLVEAFPAAQLRQWELPHSGYSGMKAAHRDTRTRILRSLVADHGLVIDRRLPSHCIEVADALDAVLCLWSANAAATGSALWPHRAPPSEGWIAVAL